MEEVFKQNTKSITVMRTHTHWNMMVLLAQFCVCVMQCQSSWSLKKKKKNEKTKIVIFSELCARFLDLCVCVWVATQEKRENLINYFKIYIIEDIIDRYTIDCDFFLFCSRIKREYTQLQRTFFNWEGKKSKWW